MSPGAVVPTGCLEYVASVLTSVTHLKVSKLNLTDAAQNQGDIELLRIVLVDVTLVALCGLTLDTSKQLEDFWAECSFPSVPSEGVCRKVFLDNYSAVEVLPGTSRSTRTAVDV